MSASLALHDRLLVRAPSWLGDFIAIEPIVRALHESRAAVGAEDRIAIAGQERFLDLFEGRFTGMERVPLRSRKSQFAHGQMPPGERVPLFLGRDAVILLNGSWRSAWCAWRAAIPRRAGFAHGGRSVLLTDPWRPALERGRIPVGLGTRGKFPRLLPRPFGAACIELVRSLGIEVRDTRPRLTVSPSARRALQERLASGGIVGDEPFILANAGARPDSAKGFPADRFAAALAEIARRSELSIVIACAPGEEANARATHAACASARSVLLVDPAIELPELTACSALARLVVTPDNGARHIAQAFDTPTVVLCGPTDPRHTSEHGPWTRVVRITVPCGPCHFEVCPLAGEAHHACMRGIEIERIVEHALDLLARTTPAARAW